MRRILALWVMVGSLGLPLAHAAETLPGRLSGSFKARGQAIALTHAYAALHDNAEGYDSGPELRIALVDRPLPADALLGTGFPPIWGMAAAGQVRGVLLSMDPARPAEVRAVLMAPEKAGEAPAGLPGRDKWTQLKIGADRVTGQVERTDRKPGIDFPWAVYALNFDMPLVREPAITADLKGRAAQGSVQIRMLRQLAAAMKAGDLAAVRRLGTARSHAARESQRKAAGVSEADYASGLKGMGRQMEGLIGQLNRVVVRGPRATAFVKTKDGGTTLSLVQEDGQWKAD